MGRSSNRMPIEEEEEEEKWLKHYSSLHRILLVAEGDFSFSFSLAVAFGSAHNIVASSLDSYDLVIRKYKNAKYNLDFLERCGALLLFGVDATTMKMHCDLQMKKFDRIIYNFPHAGFYGKEVKLRTMKKHRTLVRNFFRNASGMLRFHGEIHVSHKATRPFCCWNLEELASKSHLEIVEIVDFKIEDYPGYNNKRGSGARCDAPFPLGKCSTFKFRLSPSSRRVVVKSNKCNFCHNMKPVVLSPIASAGNDVSGGCLRIFDGCFKYVSEAFRQADNDFGYFVMEALKYSYKMYMREEPDRTLSGYIGLLQELYKLSVGRAAWLHNMLSECMCLNSFHETNSF